MASPLRGIQGQSNIISLRAEADVGWHENRTENNFKLSNCDNLHITLKPYSPFLINTNYIIQQSTDMPPIVDRYSMDSWPIFHLQYWHSLYQLSVDWYTGDVLAGVSVEPADMLVERSPTVDRYGDWESADTWLTCWQIVPTDTWPRDMHKLHKIFKTYGIQVIPVFYIARLCCEKNWKQPSALSLWNDFNEKTKIF